MESRQCETCSGDMSGRGPRARFCSAACYPSARRATVGQADAVVRAKIIASWPPRTEPWRGLSAADAAEWIATRWRPGGRRITSVTI